MSDSMIERVANTIWEENRPEFAPPYDELDLMDQLRVRQIAIACIKAMREPTAEMIVAGCPVEDNSGAPYCYDRSVTTEAWVLMIDAALKEE